MILAILIFYTDTKTVCIRICCKNKICVNLFCKFKSEFKCLCCLRVRIADCREVSVRKLLLRYYIYILKTKLFQDSSCRNITGSMKR